MISLRPMLARWRAAGRSGRAGLTTAVGPSALQLFGSHVRVGDGYAATFAAVGYPSEVGPAWLEPLLAYPGRLDVAVHVAPLPAPVAADRLRRQRARFESTRRLDAERGRLGDPMVEAAAADAADLSARIARGAARLFDVGIYVTVHARSEAELAAACSQVRAAAASTLVDLVPVTWRQQHGWTTTLPLGVDSVRMRRIFDTDALAAAFPLACADLPGPAPGQTSRLGGLLYGVNTSSAGLVWWDRGRLDNYNSVVLARSGAGKSFLVKLEVLRSLYAGISTSVIDREEEYAGLARHVGGTIVRLGARGVRLNPLDLPATDRQANTLMLRCQFLITFVALLIGGLDDNERAVLDRAAIGCYRSAGITNDPATWDRPAPLLADLGATLHADTDPTAQRLATRLAPWTTGSFSDLFAGPTTVAPHGHLVVWSLRQLSDELRSAATLLALDAIWRSVDHTGGPLGQPAPYRRLVVVDEAWLLLRNERGADFLSKLAKAARKRGTGLTVVTQDAADVLSTNLGLTVVSNATTQLLMRQAPQAIDAVTDAFRLTAGEARLLLSAPRGHALLVAGTHRVAFQVVASHRETAVLDGDDQPSASVNMGGDGDDW